MNVHTSLCVSGPLWHHYVKHLVRVNDEEVSEEVHYSRKQYLRGWLDAMKISGGLLFNGDYYYLPLFYEGLLEERPLCCGEFLDWESKA